jgi:NADPH:quinone reductase
MSIHEISRFALLGSQGSPDDMEDDMLAGWYEKGGLAENVIEVGDMEMPRAGPGEVLVRLRASSISPSDYKKRASNAPLQFPRIVPHSDGAGVVEELGAGVSDFKVGDRVWTFNAQFKRAMGTAAQYIALPASLVRPLPFNASFVEGACFGIAAMTGYRVVFADGPVKRKTFYVPGATGRVGAYAVQFAKWGGARVIASVSGEEKRKVAYELGADFILDRQKDDLATTILGLTNNTGVDRIIEVELAGNLPLDEKILAENGTICSFGARRTPKVDISISGRRALNMSLRFVHVYLLDDAARIETSAGINKAHAEGALKHRIAATFSLRELAKAHSFAENHMGTGHVVVEIER